MNAIARIQKTTAVTGPPVSDRQVDLDLAAARNALTRDYPAMPAIMMVPIPPASRARLEARRGHLLAALAPTPRADRQRMASAISGMLGAFGQGNGGSLEAIVAKYVQILEDLPLWAVKAACRAIEYGEVDGVSLDFRTSAPRMRQVVRSLMAPWDEELFNLREVLAAPTMEPQDEEMRRRLGELLSSFASDFRMGRYAGVPAQATATATKADNPSPPAATSTGEAA